jgi:hypothetical protein
VRRPVNAELDALKGALDRQREHVLGILEGLSEEDLRRPVLPSGWSCLELLRHLTVSFGSKAPLAKLSQMASSWRSRERFGSRSRLRKRTSAALSGVDASTFSENTAPACWTNRTTLTAVPRRATAFAAKAITLTGVVAVGGTVAVLGSVLAGRLILPDVGDKALSLSDAPTLRAVFGTVLYLILIGLLSLGVATAARDSATSIGSSSACCTSSRSSPRPSATRTGSACSRRSRR